MDTSKKTTLNILLLCFCFVVILALNIFLYVTGFYKEAISSIMYKENNSIHYKVYLKDNDFFETPYLEEGKTYITSLIDYIKVEYNYNIEFDKEVSGDLKYYIVASIEANKPNKETGNFWTKNYNITDVKTYTLNNDKILSLSEVIDVDYNKYNKILNEFKKRLSLSSDGVLKVYLVVDAPLTSGSMSIPVKSNLLLQMPLSEKTIEASINLDAKSNVNEITQVVETKTQKTLKLACLVISCVLEIGFVVAILLIKKKEKESNLYESKIQKILSTYDSIIVNIDKFPDITENNIITVSSFEELLDAHGEVRMPINYFNGYNKSHFILISDNTVWKYTVKKSDFK